MAQRAWRRLLRVRLTTKLAGASAVLLLATLLILFLAHARAAGDAVVATAVVSALGVSLLLHGLLVQLALAPVRTVAAVAERVQRGDLAARVPPSPLADPDIARLGETINRVLDELTADRAAMRRFAAEVLREGERTQAGVGRALHESAAQTLAALTFQLAAASGECEDDAIRERLEAMRGIAGEALDEVVRLSALLHSRILEDLGLERALEQLAQATERASGIRVDLRIEPGGVTLPRDRAMVLYCVAREAVANAVRHGRPESIRCELSAAGGAVRLLVLDDGCGFEAPARLADEAAGGLFRARQRVLLAGGSLQVLSGAGRGSLVSATIPLAERATDAA